MLSAEALFWKQQRSRLYHSDHWQSNRSPGEGLASEFLSVSVAFGAIKSQPKIFGYGERHVFPVRLSVGRLDSDVF